MLAASRLGTVSPKLAREIDSRNVDAVYDRLLSDPGISTDAKGRITVDASRLGDKSIVHALAGVTGTRSLAIPDKIDRETYNAFLALGGEIAKDVNEQFCPSYFARDGIDKLFA